MPYSLSRQASADLDELYVFGATQYGERAADEYFVALLDLFDLLVSFPRLGRDIAEGFRAVPHRAHVVIYAVLEDGSVHIARVENARSDWQGRLSR